MSRKGLLSLSVALFFVLVLTGIPKAMAEYPDKPIELVIHASPGGGSDMFCRAIAQMLDKEGLVKQKINVNNRRGGSGTVAMNYLKSMVSTVNCGTTGKKVLVTKRVLDLSIT